ncbi:MAG: PPC domain-containing protein [Anaerolinea sp.]|nr:PPC domain-containing protein [Anaerolinea sp.]
MKRLSVTIALLVFFILPLASAYRAGAQGDRLFPNDPVVIELRAGRPIELVYDSPGDDVITVYARSLELPEELDTILEVFAPSGRRIAENDDHGTDRMDLEQGDSLIVNLELADPGEYVILIDTFSGVSGGTIEVLLISERDQPETPTPEAPSDDDDLSDGFANGSVQRGETFTINIDAEAGERLTITVRGLDDFDPRVALINSKGRVEAENDDHSTGRGDLAQFDSLIEDFQISVGGTFVVQVDGYNGMAGEFTIELTRAAGGEEPGELPIDDPLVETFEESVNDNDTFQHTLNAQAGDVYTITVRSQSEGFDPTLALYSDDEILIAYNDDHGNPDVDLPRFDSQIERVIIQEDGRYFIEVAGYQSVGGSFELAIERIAQNVPTGQPEETVYVGEIGSTNEVFEQTFDAEAGDWVSVSVRGLTGEFDPYIMLIAPDGTVLAVNEDHNTRSFSLGFIDALIPNFPIFEDGEYTVEVSTTGSVTGTFAITIGTLR